ncbi:MAG: caspase family protein, partial [Armatimonadetes bacterium]|nr:caspase family protein [Armatimonadota bacterium]
MRRLLCLVLLAATAHAAETYVVVAGIDHYDREWAIAPLNYAVADAKALADAFRATGVPANNLRVLTSDETEPLKRPTAINLIDVLNRTARRCDPGDTLVFLFSGHGVQAGDESYLLTVDTDWDRLERTALPLRDVKDALAPAAGVH